ncbi:MAG: hypothetical protein FJ035_01035 [Chloroflexi bacterium]|nr:hypothetical protein [Chloroflexota bacterium]
MVRIEEPCDYGGRFWRAGCGCQAVAECVYCGHPFCEAHGDCGLAPDFTAACHRRACRAKVADLAAHLAWRQRQQVANNVSQCAAEGCGERRQHACSRCRLLFCAAHVHERTVLNRLTTPARRELALVCEHCHERSKLWDRR